MRRLLPALLLGSTLTISLFVAPVEASGQGPSSGTASVGADPAAGLGLPPGFTDGTPVGGRDVPASDVPLATASAARSAGASTNAALVRYFGQGPWDAIQAASAVTARCADLTGPELTALVTSPIFKESSAATSASSAPAPMTLSRYDEWNGLMSTTTNRSANYGLYAFRNPYTAYPRAYWHPGIGIWQYDSAGVGAPYTAIERMDVRVVAADVASGMASRYCSPPAAVVGHTAPFTEQERRDAAWWPWWAGSTTRSCPLCQAEYDKMTASTPYFANVSLVAGISATGGAQQRTCRLPGTSASVTCWYVDPSVGVIQGATGWAQLSPDGKGSPTVAPAPLSKPFYVIKRDGYEERHWLKADTGYSIDISGKRLLGKNERPRSNQVGSGIGWSSTSGLCDLTTGRGSCGVTPPPDNPVPAPEGSGLTSSITSVGGTFRPISLDANGDGKGDILWYAPGAAGDALWLGKGSGGFTPMRVSIGGTFDDVLVLDANGDGRDDLLFNTRRTGAAYLWRSKGDGTFASSRLLPGIGRTPLVGDFAPAVGDEIFWYAPGRTGDALWTWNGTAFGGTAITVAGTFSPFVGDFDRNGRDDLFWYGPGSDPDRLWLFKGSGGHSSISVSVGGPYRPLVGDFDGNGGDDVLWYGVGTMADTAWFSTTGGGFSSQTLTVNDTYDPVIADLDADGRDDVLWHAPNKTTDLWTRWGASRSRNSVSLTLDGVHTPFVGAFSAGGGDGIFWYAPGPRADAVWWR